MHKQELKRNVVKFMAMSGCLCWCLAKVGWLANLVAEARRTVLHAYGGEAETTVQQLVSTCLRSGRYRQYKRHHQESFPLEPVGDWV